MYIYNYVIYIYIYILSSTKLVYHIVMSYCHIKRQALLRDRDAQRPLHLVPQRPRTPEDGMPISVPVQIFLISEGLTQAET